MNKIEIDKDEILKSSKWVRFIFMVLYAFAINFALTICIGLAFIQFLFVLFTSKPNSSISSFNDNIIEFFNDSLGFLLFNTEQKPFPFKNDISDEEVIEAEVDEVEQAESDETSDETSEESKS
jgi:hypothetical protein|tara:strand:+ start:1308 stop:1676 length:369 start_codon:yes stop_codon:yes gene_type:complete